MEGLTKRQISILKYIHAEVDQRGYPPSVREIGEAVGLASTSTVHGHLDRLEKKGYIRRDPSKPRALEVVEEAVKDYLVLPKRHDPNVRHVPLVKMADLMKGFTGVVGKTFLPLPFILIQEETVFFVTMEDDSMKKVGIFYGDQILIRQQATASNGDIVLAAIDNGSIKVNRFYQEEHHIRLQPENDLMEPLRLNHVTIMGKVIAVLRGIA